MAWFASPWRRLSVGFVVVLVMFSAWFYSEVQPFGGSGRYVIVHVSPGESWSQLASDLQAQRVIGSSFAFRLDSLVFRPSTLNVGYFEIQENSSFSHVRSVFETAPNARAIDVEPGLTLREIAENQLAGVESPEYSVKFLDAARASAATNPFHPNGSLEGLIGSGIYVIRRGESPAQLVSAMQQRFLVRARAAGITPATTLHGLSAYQLVVAASIVEKEGYYQKNMGPVARVILNRLRRGGGLQMDSTILYSFGMDGGKVTRAMLQVNTPYNTYLHSGLTPTPICVPSVFAMSSMISPPAGKWLYFTLISRDGTMAFSDTFAQQLANEQKGARAGV